jgi:DNA-binding transcriptional MerR regulator
MTTAKGGSVMTIHDAAVLTGLTKKAIKYYEAEGLIQPRVDPENNYRAYARGRSSGST